MADLKYGRVFTEEDVKRMLEAMQGLEDVEDIYGAAVTKVESTEGLTFGADEPIFVLRGQDQCAPATIAAVEGEVARDYVGNCIAAGSQQPHVEAASAAAQQIREWQAANPTLVKIPD